MDKEYLRRLELAVHELWSKPNENPMSATGAFNQIKTLMAKSECNFCEGQVVVNESSNSYAPYFKETVTDVESLKNWRIQNQTEVGPEWIEKQLYETLDKAYKSEFELRAQYETSYSELMSEFSRLRDAVIRAQANAYDHYGRKWLREAIDVIPEYLKKVR